MRIIARRLLSRPARTIAGAAMAAILTGIVVNALVLQKARHSAPPPVAAKSSLSEPQATAPAAAAPAAVAPNAPSAPVDVRPPVRPLDLGATVDSIPLPPTRSNDPIRDLLRGEVGHSDAAKETARLTLAAQNALNKLGFAVKANGVAGPSTEQAI